MGNTNTTTSTKGSSYISEEEKNNALFASNPYLTQPNPILHKVKQYNNQFNQKLLTKPIAIENNNYVINEKSLLNSLVECKSLDKLPIELLHMIVEYCDYIHGFNLGKVVQDLLHCFHGQYQYKDTLLDVDSNALFVSNHNTVKDNIDFNDKIAVKDYCAINNIITIEMKTSIYDSNHKSKDPNYANIANNSHTFYQSYPLTITFNNNKFQLQLKDTPSNAYLLPNNRLAIIYIGKCIVIYHLILSVFLDNSNRNKLITLNPELILLIPNLNYPFPKEYILITNNNEQLYYFITNENTVSYTNKGNVTAGIEYNYKTGQLSNFKYVGGFSIIECPTNLVLDNGYNRIVSYYNTNMIRASSLVASPLFRYGIIDWNFNNPNNQFISQSDSIQVYTAGFNESKQIADDIKTNTTTTNTNNINHSNQNALSIGDELRFNIITTKSADQYHKLYSLNHNGEYILITHKHTDVLLLSHYNNVDKQLKLLDLGRHFNKYYNQIVHRVYVPPRNNKLNYSIIIVISHDKSVNNNVNVITANDCNIYYFDFIQEKVIDTIRNATTRYQQYSDSFSEWNIILDIPNPATAGTLFPTNFILRKNVK